MLFLYTELEEIKAHLKESFSHQTRNIESLHLHTCGGTGGWRRAVYFDMKDPNTNCPTGWNMTGYSKRSCSRTTSGCYTCDSVFFPVSGGPYSQVCGRIQAYQASSPGGFSAYRRGQTTIDSSYFSGVAVMHGNPRQHIWTFAAGAGENWGRHSDRNCPCDTTGNVSIPWFVGDDYFCESGHEYFSDELWSDFHSNDVLWDGKDCHPTSTCCSHHNPPYFTKTFNHKIANDLELRMCHVNTVAP